MEDLILQSFFSSLDEQSKIERGQNMTAIRVHNPVLPRRRVDAAHSYSDVEKFALNVPQLASRAFDAANGLTRFLLAKGWRYDLRTYQLFRMFKKKTGNCLGLSCLYGALLQAKGFQPEYELVVGPNGYQRRIEQGVLDRLLSGGVFPFDEPLLPERQMQGGDLLHFCTLEHPRLVLDGQRFETTTLAEQEPSTITGESVRSLSYQALTGLVYYEQANAACNGKRPDFTLGQQLLQEAIACDPENREALSEKVTIPLHAFEDDEYAASQGAYAEIGGNDSQYFLQRYYLFGDEADLDRGLEKNPTDMRLWVLKHVVLEQDIRNQRANIAVAAQCIARSEILNLGDFYAQHAALLGKLFPEDAISLLGSSRNASTDPFGFYLALVALSGKQKVSTLYINRLLNVMGEKYRPSSPFQEARLFFHLKSHPRYSDRWDSLCCQFGNRRTFQDTVAGLEQQWA